MRTFVNTAIVLALLVLLQGCDVIERTEPSTSISQETALSSPDAVEGIRARMYDRFHAENMSTDWLLGPSSQADNTFYRLSQGRHQGLNVNQRRAGIGTGAWGNFYDTINDANLLISGIEEGVLSDAKARQYEAEGRFIRALVMHHAVRIFGYEPGMQPNSGPGSEGNWENLGIVIRTEPTLSVDDATEKPRAPVSDVYDQIVTDLNEATTMFDQGPEEGGPNYASEAAAQALLARVQLYQRNWSEADAAAQNALASVSLADPSNLEAIFDETTESPEHIFTIETDPVNESAGVNNSLSSYTEKYWMAQIPTEDLLDLYPAGDQRKDAWYGPCYDEIDSARPDGCEDINTHEDDLEIAGYDDDPYTGLELQKYQAEAQADAYADDYVHLRAAEMVLIQAEARLHTDGISAAISRLNDLRTQRGAPQLNASNYSSEEEVIDEILAERRRELVAEGHRFFDLKRLGRDIQKSDGKLSETGEEEFVPFEDIRVLDDIPSSQLEINSELVQNPGYN